MVKEALQSISEIAKNLMKEFAKKDFLIDADNEECDIKICDKKYKKDSCRIVIDFDSLGVRITLENQADGSLDCQEKILNQWEKGRDHFFSFFDINDKNAFEKVMIPGAAYLDVEDTVSRFIKAYHIAVGK